MQRSELIRYLKTSISRVDCYSEYERDRLGVKKISHRGKIEDGKGRRKKENGREAYCDSHDVYSTTSQGYSRKKGRLHFTTRPRIATSKIVKI